MSALFIGEHFYERSAEGNELIKQLIILGAFGSKMRFYTLQMPPYIVKDFILV